MLHPVPSTARPASKMANQRRTRRPEDKEGISEGRQFNHDAPVTLILAHRHPPSKIRDDARLTVKKTVFEICPDSSQGQRTLSAI